LASNHPEFAQGRKVTVREVLDSAALRIAGAFANNPLLEAAIREAIGETYSKLSVFDKAEAHLQAAYETRRRLLGVEHPDTLASRRALGALRVLQLREAEGEQVLKEVLAVHQRTLGPEHEETLRTLDALFDAMAAQAESAGLAKPKRQSLLDAIEELARSAYAAATKRLGPEHPLALTHLQHLAWALYLACVWDLREGGAKPEKVAEFAALAEQLLTIRRRVLGPEHPDTILAIDMRARAFGVQGNKAQKVQLLRECLALTERVMGPDHWLTGCSYYLVGLNLRATAERAEAGPLLLRAARILLKAYGWDSGSSAQFLSLLGKLAIEDGHGEPVAKFAEELLPEARRQSPTANAVLRSLAAVLGEAYLVQGRAGEAEPLLRETLALYETAGLGTTRGFITESLLGESLLAQRRFAEAEPRLLAGYQGMKSRLDSMVPMLHPQLWNAAERLVRLYTDWGQMAKADEWKKALADLGPRPGPVPLRSQPTKP
jgi:tetratricopeptide (TPR) repeat protein